MLVNNSGVSWGEPLDKYQEKGWDKVMDVNVKGLFFLTRELLPLLEATASSTDPARIINIGSVAGTLQIHFAYMLILPRIKSSATSNLRL